jgi:prophage antirepressor-like protein
MLKNHFDLFTVHHYLNNPESEIRTIRKQDESIWFVAQDVCDIIDIVNIDQKIKNIRAHDRFPLHLRRQAHEFNEEITEFDMVSEGGLKILIDSTKTAEATKFLKWVERDILGRVNGDDNYPNDDFEENNQPANMFSFQFHNSVDHEIRTIQKEDGSIWFVNKDVCDTLHISKHRDALSRLDEDERGSVKLDTPGGKQKISIISESGLYTLVLRSNKPEAKKFRKWVTSEVLPQIRQTGSYIQGTTVQNEPISAKAVAAFLQATTDTFWGIEKALTEYRAAEVNLKKARKDASKIIRSIRQAFPSSGEAVNLLGALDGPLLEVEMR